MKRGSEMKNQLNDDLIAFLNESHNEYLLHLVLSWIDELCDLNKELISKNLIK